MANDLTWVNDAHEQFTGDALAAWDTFCEAREAFEAEVRAKLADQHSVTFSYKRGGVSLGLGKAKAKRASLAEYLRA